MRGRKRARERAGATRNMPEGVGAMATWLAAERCKCQKASFVCDKGLLYADVMLFIFRHSV